MIGKAKMSMKAALTFTCLNIKKLAKLIDRLDSNGGGIPPIFDKFTLFFEKMIILRMQTEKAPINPIY